MSGKQSGLVWEIQLFDSKGVSRESKKNVLLAMADHADHNGENVFPSVGLLAWKTDLSSRQVVRVIRTLIDDKLVILEEENFGRYHTRNYSLTLENGMRKAKYKNRNTPLSLDVTPPVTPVCHAPPDIQVSPEPSVESSVEPLAARSSLAAGSMLREANSSIKIDKEERVTNYSPILDEDFPEESSMDESDKEPSRKRYIQPKKEFPAAKYLAAQPIGKWKNHWQGFLNKKQEQEWAEIEDAYIWKTIKEKIDFFVEQGVAPKKIVRYIIKALKDNVKPDRKNFKAERYKDGGYSLG